jgi:predicted DCC family thiol-disulfide oxidoreductase YuxK
MSQLRGAWPVLSSLRIVPRFLRDRIYDGFASKRYRWFGKKEACMIPTPEMRHRFLE